MGFFTAIVRALGIKKKSANIIIIGLDNSGKSSILNNLKPPETKIHDIVPTIGFNVEKFQVKSLQITAFDMSGQGKYRDMWKEHYRECHGIIFVVDSSDKIRMVVAEEELGELLACDETKGKRIPILFFANKMDCHGALTSCDVSKSLKLAQIKDKPWFICATNALTGEGITEGTEWLEEQLKECMKIK